MSANDKKKYNLLKEQKFQEQTKKFHQKMSHYVHPIRATKANADEYAQLGRDHWKETVSAPNMSREEAFKQAGNAFTNLGISSKFAIVFFVLMIVGFALLGMF